MANAQCTMPQRQWGGFGCSSYILLGCASENILGLSMPLLTVCKGISQSFQFLVIALFVGIIFCVKNSFASFEKVCDATRFKNFAKSHIEQMFNDQGQFDFFAIFGKEEFPSALHKIQTFSVKPGNEFDRYF